MLAVIDALAEQVEQRWARTGWARDAFPGIAAQALHDHPPPDFPTVARALSRDLCLPRQRRLDQSFGQPALTLFGDDRFVVEALCWHTGSPAIHQHSFAGAFRITTGRSVHGRYRFTERERVAETVAVGDLDLVDVEVLDQGCVTQISPGSALIHSAFHLDNPSMTVVVRTHDDDQPEYTYLPPGVAYDPSVRSETLHKRLQLLDTMRAVEHPAYEECLGLALDAAGVYEGIELLMRVGGHGLPEPVLAGFVGRYEERHGPRVGAVVAAVREQRRRSQLLALRSSVRDVDTRYVLACLLNALDRPSFLRQLASGPDSARTPAVVAACLRSLLGTSAESDAFLALASGALLTGVVPEAFPSWVAARTTDDVAGGTADLLETLYREVGSHPLLTPLLPV